MSGCAFYTGVPGWLQVLEVLVQIGFMVTLAVAAIMIARQYSRRVNLKIAEKAAHDAKHGQAPTGTPEAAGEKSAGTGKPAGKGTPDAPAKPAESDISVEPFVD